MTNDRSCRDVGKLCCISRFDIDGAHPSCHADVAIDSSDGPSLETYYLKWHPKSSSQLDILSSSTSALQKIFSLPKDYFVQCVCAKSETIDAKYQPVASSFVEHLHASHTSSFSASFPVPSPIALQTSSTQTATSSPTTRTVAYLGSEAQSGLVQTPNPQYFSTSEQNQIPVPFQHHLQREGEFICGWGAAFINICITFPINKAMFRQQLHGISGLRAINQLRNDGPRFLYRGLLPPLLQKTSSLSVMFGMYYKCQDILQSRIPKMNIYANHTLAALGAGTIEAIFTPFERIQALMQTREYHNKFSNTLDAFYNLRSYGLKEYYRGFSAIVLRNGPSNVAFFLGREYLQDHGPRSSSYGQKVMLDFMSGACLGAVISTCFFPLNVVKIRMQCVLGGPFTGMWMTLKTVVMERNGLSGLYKGIHLNYMRSFVSWGIINASYELLMKALFVHNS